MGAHCGAQIHFGIVLDEDWLYEHYDPFGAYLESDSEWQGYEYTSEALEAHAERLCEGTNLHVIQTGDATTEDFTEHLLCLKEPSVSTDSASGYGCTFDPKLLDVGAPEAHPDGLRIAKALDLDWMTADWHLRWSNG